MPQKSSGNSSNNSANSTASSFATNAKRVLAGISAVAVSGAPGVSRAANVQKPNIPGPSTSIVRSVPNVTRTPEQVLADFKAKSNNTKPSQLQNAGKLADNISKTAEAWSQGNNLAERKRGKSNSGQSR